MAGSLDPSTAAGNKRARAYTKTDDNISRHRSLSRRRSIEQNHEADNDGNDRDSHAEEGDGNIDVEEGGGSSDAGYRKNGDDQAGEGDGADTEVGVNIKAEDGGPRIVAEDGVNDAEFGDMTKQLEKMRIERKGKEEERRDKGNLVERQVRARRRQ